MRVFNRRSMLSLTQPSPHQPCPLSFASKVSESIPAAILQSYAFLGSEQKSELQVLDKYMRKIGIFILNASALFDMKFYFHFSIEKNENF